MSLDARGAAALFDPDRLRAARQLNGWSRAELARRAELSAAAISQFESGSTKPRAATLAQLALALGVPVRFLAATASPFVVPNVQESFFRSLRRTTQRDKERAAAVSSLLGELVRAVEDRVVLPTFETFPDLALDSSDSVEAAEHAANEVRRRWNIPEGPIDNVVRLLERHGLVVCRLPLLTKDVDAFSWGAGSRPLILLGSDKGVFERSRLDAAHELGHMLLHVHDPEPAQQNLERQAQRFAGALLFPEADFRREWPGPRINWDALLHLKTRWGLSMAAILYRSKELELLSPTAFENSMKYLSAKGWRVREPGQRRSPEEPALLNEALGLLEAHGTTLADLGDLAHLLGDDDLRTRLQLSPQVRLAVAV